MANSPERTSLIDDTGTFVLSIAISFAALLFLTPVGLIGVFAPLWLYRLSHRPTWSVWSLAAAALLLLGTFLTGHLAAVAAEPVRIFFGAMARPSEFSSFVSQWLASIGAPIAWITLGPVGLAVGSAWTLITHENEQSSLNALMQGRAPDRHKRAPLAPWFHRLVEARPALRGGSITIGSDWRTGAAVRIPASDLNKHLLVVGTTGVGKTTGLLNLIEGCQAGTGMVIVDGKGDFELARSVIAKAKARGQKAYLFDATGHEQSAVYNPIGRGDFTSLADRIMTMREWTEPHYRTLAEGFAQIAFKVLQVSRKPLDLLSASAALDTKVLTSLLRRISKGGGSYTDLMAEVSAQRNAEPHIEGLRAELRNLAASVFAPLFDTKRANAEGVPVIDLQRAREEGALVYFCLPALQYPAQAAKLGKLIVNDIKYAATTSQHPWLIVLDEFSVFAGPQVLNLINMGRSQGLSAILSTQSLADIAQGAEKDGRSFTDQVIGSVNTFIIYRLNSAEDCELAASVAGTEEQVEFTAQTVSGTSTGAASARLARSFKVHPDTIKNLGVGEAIYINKNAPRYRTENCLMIKARFPSV